MSSTYQKAKKAKEKTLAPSQVQKKKNSLSSAYNQKVVLSEKQKRMEAKGIKWDTVTHKEEKDYGGKQLAAHPLSMPPPRLAEKQPLPRQKLAPRSGTTRT